VRPIFKFASTANAGPGSANCAEHRHDRRRHCHLQIAEHRSHQPTIRHHVPADRRPSSRAGPGWARGSVTAWAATTRTSVLVVMISQGSRNKTDKPIFPAVGSGFLAHRASGCPFRSKSDSRAVPVQSAGVDAASRRAHAGRRRRLTNWRSSRSGTRRSITRIASTKCIPHADLVPADRLVR